ncbi:hypothetical protein HDU98_000764 [Podochytrium sp. JEL0797]|nr:hypothetical protein HDU98_000764 [Podochytrium sp. JEL0797]
MATSWTNEKASKRGGVYVLEAKVRPLSVKVSEFEKTSKSRSTNHLPRGFTRWKLPKEKDVVDSVHDALETPQKEKDVKEMAPIKSCYCGLAKVFPSAPK